MCYYKFYNYYKNKFSQLDRIIESTIKPFIILNLNHSNEIR